MKDSTKNERKSHKKERKIERKNSFQMGRLEVKVVAQMPKRCLTEFLFTGDICMTWRPLRSDTLTNAYLDIYQETMAFVNDTFWQELRHTFVNSAKEAIA